MEAHGDTTTVNDERLLTVPEAARLLGMGKSWTWQRVLDGELPSVRLSRGARRIRPVDLETFIADRLTDAPEMREPDLDRAQSSRDGLDGSG
jgi:excisionase family DNA binding protein